MTAHLAQPPSQPEPITAISDREWPASLSLTIGKRKDKSIVKHSRHHGPLRIQRPFYPENDDTCHIYILHPPGGLVAGDHLTLDFELESGSNSVLTTPSAGRFYRTDSWGHQQTQHTHLKLADNACCEWLPQETIFFNDTNALLNNRYDLTSNSRLITWEIVCLGRPFGEEPYVTGKLRQNIELNIDMTPIFIERNHYDAPSKLLSARWGLANHTVQGTLLAYGLKKDISEQLKTLNRSQAPLVATTQMQELLVCRYLGDSAEEAKNIFTELWQQIRPELMQKPVEIPRIWNT